MLTKTETSPLLLRVAPGLQSLVDYQREWLRADLSAGITLAAYLLPAGIGDASLAGLPPEAGLYACMFSGLVFWLFCSSRQTAITVTSAISLLVGTSLGQFSGGDPAHYAALAACTALFVARMAAFPGANANPTNACPDATMVACLPGVILTIPRRPPREAAT